MRLNATHPGQTHTATTLVMHEQMKPKKLHASGCRPFLQKNLRPKKIHFTVKNISAF